MQQGVAVAEPPRINIVVNGNGAGGHSVVIETRGHGPQRAYKNPLLAPVLHALKTGKVKRLNTSAAAQGHPANRTQVEQLALLLQGTRIVRSTISSTYTIDGTKITFTTRRTIADGN